MFEQSLWVLCFVQVAEREAFWVGEGGLLDLFNLCAVCMNKLLSIYKEPGLEVPSLYLTHHFPG